jgi:hypothetical protein
MNIKLFNYKIKRSLKPDWIGYVERKKNYTDWQTIINSNIIKYFHHLKLDPEKKQMLKTYFKDYGKKLKLI